LIKQLAVEASPYSWLYFCLRKKGNPGYPESCNVLSDLINVVSSRKSAESAVSVFRVWVEFLRSRNTDPSWNEMEEHSGEEIKFFKNSMIAAREMGATAVSDMDHVNSPPLIVVLNEASSLFEVTLLDAEQREISLFRLLRQALHTLSHIGRKRMVILIVTNFRVSEFTPPSLVDPSLRFRITDDGNIRYHNLLPPYYRMNTADVLADYRELKGGELAPLFLLGRPLWERCGRVRRG